MYKHIYMALNTGNGTLNNIFNAEEKNLIKHEFSTFTSSS